MSYLRQYSTRRTPQSEPLPGQVPNSAGGHSYEVDDWKRMQRFLVLGSEGGSYYASEQKLTRENAKATIRCIAQDGQRAVKEIVDVSRAGRAPKNDPAIFALALAASTAEDSTRKLALDHLSNVCRTGTHLFTFASYVENFRGWGRGLRAAVAQWYEREDLAYQLVKYRQRNGWTHRDLLRLAHPAPSSVLAWAVGKRDDVRWENTPYELLEAFERAQRAETPYETSNLIRDYPNLPREALKPEHLTAPIVWEALLEQGMPMTALIRNLATMTRIGVVKPFGASTGATRRVIEQITNGELLRKARVHPLAILVALKTYEHGISARGDASWTPVSEIVDALDSAFYASFGHVESSGKRTLLALDVSGSMAWGRIAGMPGITPRVGAAAMALVTAAIEPSHYITAFSHELVPVTISPRQRLDDVMRTLGKIPMGGTDCALPMIWALKNRVEVDTFVVYTDSETWAGDIHPSQALVEYRQKMGIDAKLVVVGMVSNGFTIASPDDPGMLDVVGFDLATPSVLTEFSRG